MQDPRIDDPTASLEDRVNALVAHARSKGGPIELHGDTPEAVQASEDIFQAARTRGVRFYLRAKGPEVERYEVCI